MKSLSKNNCLIILDGWGYSEETKHNAISKANPEHWNTLWAHYPHTLIEGSGTAVGLPPDQMGNSEVGHLNIGMGRVIHQDLSRINASIESGDFFSNSILLSVFQQAKQNNKRIHVMGLLSPGGVHSHMEHFFALLTLANKLHFNALFIHAFLDGRDTPPQSALGYMDLLEAEIKANGGGCIASIIGRYYAMDRDKRWTRTEMAYLMLTEGEAPFVASSVHAAIQGAYARGETDEFIAPTIIATNFHPIEDGDSIIFMNFRADRARQLTRAFIEKEFTGFTRSVCPKLNAFVSLTEYAEDLATQIAFPPDRPRNGLGEIISTLGGKQLRIAETEKYAHVTFFFNGGIETPFPGEERVLIPSPRIATYDLQPEMSAFELTDNLIKALESQEYNLIVCNFANPDMVGHSGNFDATIKAITAIDTCLDRIHQTLLRVGGEMLITADHGNAECMFDETTQQPHTAHTSLPVPLIYIGRKAHFIYKDGTLSDLAPTLLSLMGINPPAEMTGRCLLQLE